MEINRIDIEKPQEIVWSSTSDDQELGQAVRSFRCTFCKRGFSNAQALGGHMNVHRKDRARLKGSLDETLFSMDVMKKSPSDDHPPASPDDHNLLQPESSDDHDKNCTHKRPWIFSADDEESPRRKDGFKEVLQLPLFVEASSSTNDLGTSSCVDGHVEKSIQLRQPASSISEVDLELRLGPEPKD